MNKPFNPKTKKVTTIGEELRFQREYYCYKNNVSLPLKIDSTDKTRDERESLQDVLYDFMDRNFDNNSEYATSYDVLYAIENGKSKKKNDPYNPNSYFLRMFCLFKIYGFLDNMTILEILKDKYKLEPSFESSKKIIINLEEGCTLDYLIRNGQKGKAIKINIKDGKAKCSKDTYLKFCSEDEKDEVNKMYNKTLERESFAYHYKTKPEQKNIAEETEVLEKINNWINKFELLLKDNNKMSEKLMKKLDNLEELNSSIEVAEEFYRTLIEDKDFSKATPLLEEYKFLVEQYGDLFKEEQYATFVRKEFPIELFNEFKELLKDNKQLSIITIEKLLKKGDRISLLGAVQNFSNTIRKLKELLKDSDKKEKLKYKKFMKKYKDWEINGKYIEEKIKIENPEDSLMWGYIFTSEKKELQDKMKKLSQLERYCISLELGRDTSYIDSFINNTLQGISIDTLLQTLEYFNMKDYEFYNVLNIIKRDFSYDSMRFSYYECI